VVADIHLFADSFYWIGFNEDIISDGSPYLSKKALPGRQTYARDDGSRWYAYLI